MGADALGDRMKGYEKRETEDRFLPLIPVYARIDGRGFSRFTKGLARPYDARFRQLMIATTAHLVEATQARVGYTQSDEISLCWVADRSDQSIFFDGRKQKMISQLGALATGFFVRELAQSPDPFLRSLVERAPTFDARVFQVPTREECTNAFLWRELDATKNALSMAAREHYTPRQMHGKNGSDLHEMLFQAGVNFNDYPANFKRGTYVQRREFVEPIAPEVLEKIPVDRRPDPAVATRHRITALELPPLLKIANRTEVLFDAATPVLMSEVAPTAQATKQGFQEIASKKQPKF